MSNICESVAPNSKIHYQIVAKGIIEEAVRDGDDKIMVSMMNSLETCISNNSELIRVHLADDSDIGTRAMDHVSILNDIKDALLHAQQIMPLMCDEELPNVSLQPITLSNTMATSRLQVFCESCHNTIASALRCQFDLQCGFVLCTDCVMIIKPHDCNMQT